MPIQLLDDLPDKGWGTITAPLALIFLLHEYGLVKVQLTPYPGVFQIRLTRKGRRWRQQRQQETVDHG